ncbi:MAG: hypothetical protein J5632_00640 [Bacteroidales bacterium]|nr:hypothetical protein [Bacteroidales bacterium]
MKKTLLLIMMLSMVIGASAQSRLQHRRSSGIRRHEPQRVEPPRHHDRHAGPAHEIVADTPCIREWQELWNGCHVRIGEFRVKVLDHGGSTVVSGEEIVLLHNGDYLVRNGDIWRIYDWRGGHTSISGHEIHLWPNGLYPVRFGSSWRVYTPEGNRLFNVWGDRVELMRNGLIRCERGGRLYYYDDRGNERR